MNNPKKTMITAAYKLGWMNKTEYNKLKKVSNDSNK